MAKPIVFISSHFSETSDEKKYLQTIPADISRQPNDKISELAGINSLICKKSPSNIQFM